MSTDPWAKTWTLNYADNKAVRDKLLVKSGLSPSIFTLTPVYDGSTLVAYRVDFKAGEMTSCWNGCYLFPRGGNVNTPTLPDDGKTSLPLPRWTLPTSGTVDPPNAPYYKTVADNIEQTNDAHPGIARLEGDIHPTGMKPEAVTLWQVKNTPTHDILSNHIFLCVNVVCDCTSQENGIAHGND